MFTALKDKKSSHDDNERKSGFQTIAIKLYKKPKKQTKKERLKLAISSIRPAVVAKTDNEIYGISTIKIYSHTSFLPKKVELLKISKVIQLLWKLLLPYKHGREEGVLVQSLLHPVVFQKRKYQVFWSIFGSCPLQLTDQLSYDCVKILALKYYQYCSGYLLAYGKRQVKHWNKIQSLLKLIIMCTRTIDCRFPSVFLKNLYFNF